MSKTLTNTSRSVAAAVIAAAATAPAAMAAPPSQRVATKPVFVVSEIQRALGTRPALGVPVTNRLTLRPDATKSSPAERADEAVARMEAAGDRIAKRPYVYGGGHGSFDAAGYDCSGSVSYVLHAAGLLDAPMASGGFTSYGIPGKGKRVTTYANGGHMFMVIDGRRFDTIAFKASGSRWSDTIGSTAGYVVRHPPGL